MVRDPNHCTRKSMKTTQYQQNSHIGRNGVERGPRGPRRDWRPSWLDTWMDGLRPSPAVEPTPAAPAEHPTAEPKPRPTWPSWDERGAKPCRRCGGPVIWGKIESDEWGEATTLQIGDRNFRTWMLLDPDLMPHGCRPRRASLEMDVTGPE